MIPAFLALVMHLWQEPQQPQLPQVDFTVEVVGKLPMEEKVQTLTRLLGRRQTAGNTYRRSAPTILELITLVKPNPEKPRGRNWDSIRTVTLRHHAEPDHVVVEYCVDFCDFDPQTGALHPRRKMVRYRAPVAVVEQRLDKKLRNLQKFKE